MANHAVANHKHSALRPQAPLALSFSASRYPAETFGQVIRQARLETGLRQVDVAQAIGVDPMTIVNWEQRDRLPRRFKKVQLACEALDLDFSEIVDRFYGIEEQASAGLDLQKKRVKKGLTQEEAARAAGIDPGTLRRWEAV